MRYGYCTGFATPVKERIDDQLLENIKAAGFDYVELPLTLTNTLTETDFQALIRRLAALELRADASCNMFPAALRVIGSTADRQAIRGYLRQAFDRLSALQTQTLVFGSSGARNLPEGMTQAAGYEQITDLIVKDVLPLLEETGIVLVMEPIGGYEANFIRTLPEGMEVVTRVKHPQVQLLADSVHLLWEKEDPADITRFQKELRHIHICESERALPINSYTPELEAILTAIRHTGYDRTMSFEPMPYPMNDMAKALGTLKAFMSQPCSR